MLQDTLAEDMREWALRSGWSSEDKRELFEGLKRALSAALQDVSDMYARSHAEAVAACGGRNLHAVLQHVERKGKSLEGLFALN